MVDKLKRCLECDKILQRVRNKSLLCSYHQNLMRKQEKRKELKDSVNEIKENVEGTNE